MYVSKFLLTLFVGSLFSIGAAHNETHAGTHTGTLGYAFQNGTLSGPETVALNGFQRITFANRSDGEMNMTLTRLEEDATLRDYEAADRAVNAAFSEEEGDARGPLNKLLAFAAAVGGVHLRPQSEGSAYLRLEPGRYVVSASSGGGPGEPYRPANLLLTVTAGERAAAPEADVRLEMVDYHFDLPDTLPPGESLWAVANAGAEPHFALVFRLNEGKTAEDVTAWMTSFAGPPPVDPGSGTILQTATAGETFYTPVTLTPGSYVAVCPLPNLASGTPHFADGMVDTFTVE